MSAGGGIAKFVCHEHRAEPDAPANAGWTSRLHSDVIGPAWLRFSLSEFSYYASEVDIIHRGDAW